MLSKFSVKKPFTVFVAIIIVIILGVVSYTKMTVDLIPSLNLPYAVVVTTYPGASPEEIETNITAPLEQSLASVSNIKNMQSFSQENVSLLMLEYYGDTNMDSSMIEMREYIDMYTSMPTYPETAGSPMIIKISLNLMPVEVITASMKDMSAAASSEYIEEKIMPEINSVSGVSSVTSSGLLKNMVDVTISKDKLETLQEDIKTALTEYMEEQIAKVRDQVIATAGEEIQAQVAAGLAAAGIRTSNPEYQQLFEEAYAKAVTEAVTAAMSGATDGAASGDTATENPDDTANTDTANDTTAADPMAEMLSGISQITDSISADMIKGILAADNFSMPAGSVVDQEGNSYAVKVGDKYADIEDFKNQVLFEVPNYGNVTLADVAEITEYNNLDTIYSKINGESAVMLVIMKDPEFSTATVTNAVQDRIDELMAEHEGLHFEVLMNQGDYVNIMVDSITQNLLIGALLAVIIIVIFLRRFRPTLVVSASILISLVFTLVLMYLGGISLNMISMGGLLLGVGMLVDNSIVVIENIFRRRGEGEDSKTAAVNGANQVAGAITASTLTTIVVFVPIVFTTGITKQLFTDMALTIAFALVASLIVALTLVPSATAPIKASKRDSKVMGVGRLGNAYGKILEKSLKVKWLSLILAIVLLGGSVWGGVNSGVQLFPSMDSGQVSVTPAIPVSYTWNERVAALDKLNDILLNIPEAKTVGIIDTSNDTSAEGSMMSLVSSDSGATVYLLLEEERDRTTDEITDELKANIKNADFGFDIAINSSSMDMSALSGSAISMSVYANDLDRLQQVTNDVMDIIKNTEGVEEVESSLDSTQTELRIRVNKNQAILQNLTVAQIYQTVATKIAAPSAATTITKDDGTTYSIYVKDDSDMYNSDNIGEIVVDDKGNKVKDFATIENVSASKTIVRSNQERVSTISGSLAKGYDVLETNNKIEDALKNYSFPQGVRYEITGESESINEAFSDLFLMLILAVIFIYLVMVAQFQSLLSPFIVMFTLPLAATGGFLGLLLAGEKVSAVALIGFVLLAGVIVNNGIVFVDYANQMREQGMSVTEALVKTGKDRLRPILMTALTTIIAMSTTIFSTGQGSEMIKPMAVVNVGGLLYGTLLTLFVVPSLYAILVRNKKDKKGKKDDKKQPFAISPDAV